MKLWHFAILLLIVFLSCKKEAVEQNNTNGFSPQDSILFSTLIDSLSNNYPENRDSIILLSDNLISKFNYNKTDILILISRLHFEKKQYQIAEQYAIKTAHIFLKHNLIERYAEQITNIGVYKEVSGDYEEAIKKYIVAINIFDSLKIPQKSSFVLNNIGIIYQALNQNDKALYYYKEAVNKTTNSSLLVAKYNNIGTIFENEELQNLDSAEYYYTKSINSSNINTTNPNVFLTKCNLAYIYIKQKKFIKADSLLEISFNYFNNNNHHQGLAPILRNQALLLSETGNHNKAIVKANLALQESKKNELKTLEIKALKVLVTVYENNNNFAKANNYLKQYYLKQQEISDIEETKHINTLNIKYQANKKEQKIKVLELKNSLKTRELIFLIILIISLIIIISVLFYTYKLNKKNNKLKMFKMRSEIADYISQIEEIKEQVTKNENIKNKSVLQKIKEYNLTKSEEKVLLLITEGYKNAEIAEKLFVTINTVKTHTKNIFMKLNVRNRVEASTKAQKL